MSYFCDAELVEGDWFIADTLKIRNVETRSSEKAYSGKFSCKTTKDNKFAFTTELYNIKKGEIINARVWLCRKEASRVGDLIISDNAALQYDSRIQQIRRDGEWVFIQNSFTAAQNYDTVKVYILNSSGKDLFVDDLSITRQASFQYPPVDDSSLRIFIPDNEYQKLDSFLQVGKTEKVLRSALKKYVRGFIINKNDSTPIKLRLKGDWTDHLKSDKFSLRIKISGDHAYKGLKSFSIQNPETRSILREWYIHKLCDYEDVLTTRYEFVNVEINGEIKGVYALEEHFDKQLLEARKRREGPIVKLDESGFWQGNYDMMTREDNVHSPSFLASTVLPFKKNRTYKSPSLHQQFLIAQNHVHKYKTLQPNPKEFLDLERFAKFIGIMDMGGIHHSLVWHNQRQYYNPITSKLEPIAYDCYQQFDHMIRTHVFYLKPKKLDQINPERVNMALVNSEKFRPLYLDFMQKVSVPNYLDQFHQSIEKELNECKELLSHEYPFSYFDLSFYNQKRDSIVKGLPILEDFLTNFSDPITFRSEEWDPFPDGLDLFREDIALKAHTESSINDSSEISLCSYHLAPIKMFAYSTSEAPNELIHLDNPISFKAFSSGHSPVKRLTLPSTVKYLHYLPKNLKGKVAKAKVSKWPLPKHTGVLENYAVLPTTDNDGIKTLKQGTYSFTLDQLVKDAKELVIEAGTIIDLTNGASFISEIPVKLQGTVENPIIIMSSDSTASGFNVISNSGTSTFSYVNFKGLNSMNKNNWILTGAVTIYGHHTELRHCTFDGNLCEDALNIVRSSFIVDNCIISNTLSDGFDADFCTGTLSKSTITSTGNDALDFSGCQINIVNCSIDNAGDKGISGGENSQLNISNCSVESAVIGIAAKDFSQLELQNVELKSCNYGYAAFRKKPEYGPASIFVNSPIEKEISSLFLLDKDSKIVHRGKVHQGTDKLDIEQLYARFESQ